jgi:hypothetical protein
MLGGSDMNVFGAATQGKSVEKKTVAETFLAGHGSPFVAQVSIANAPKLYKAMLDALEYRGTAFLQCFTTCQPEHGVPDDMSLLQAQRVRDSRGAPEFVFNPRLGETYREALDLAGNPARDRDWYETRLKSTGETYRFTIAHWCATEARFRNHLRKITAERAAELIPLENMLVRLTQNDVVYRRYLDPRHRAWVPDFGVAIEVQVGDTVEHRAISRQLVLFCVERRKAWRLLQSKAGIENADYEAQRSILADVDAGRVSREELFARGHEMLRERAEEGRNRAKRAEPARPSPEPVSATPPPAPAVQSGVVDAPAASREALEMENLPLVTSIVLETQPGRARSVADLLSQLRGMEHLSVEGGNRVLATWHVPAGQNPEPEGFSEVLRAMSGEILEVTLVNEPEQA